MFNCVSIKRGQSILEYAVVSACVIAALVGMQIYVKRGISGGLRNSADTIGKQYDPGFTTSTISTTIVSDSVTKQELRKNVDVDGDGKPDFTSDTYMVIGPGEGKGWVDKNNNQKMEEDEFVTIITADATRSPEKTTISGTETVSKVK